MAEMNQAGETPGDGGTPANDGNNQPELTFEGWLGAQPDDVKGLIDGHVNGLKSALDSERIQRKELAKQLKDLSRQTEAGSQAREALEAMSGKLESFEQQLAAYDALSAAGVTNLRLAYIAAREAEAIRKDGTVDLETLKAQYPELFKTKAAPPGRAGSGTNQLPPTGQTSMDDWIRKQVGAG